METRKIQKFALDSEEDHTFQFEIPIMKFRIQLHSCPIDHIPLALVDIKSLIKEPY